MARKTKEEAERTYHAILDAATALFIRQGVANTTLKDIAAEAGMTRGAIYWHFDNKDAVIQALWLRNADTLHQNFSDMLEHITPPHAAANFRQGIKNMIQSLVNEPELGQILRIVIHNVEYTDQQTELQEFLKQKKESFDTAMTSAFTALKKCHALKVDLPPDLLAQSLLSYIHGLIHTYLSPVHRKLDLRKDGNVLIDLFLDALLVK